MTEQEVSKMFAAAFYMYFVAFGGGMGLLTVAAIGFKLYKRSLNKQQQKSDRKGRA